MKNSIFSLQDIVSVAYFSYNYIIGRREFCICTTSELTDYGKVGYKMETGTRREQILHLLESQQKPVSGTVLSRLFRVSRQVIVQDIALLRVENKNILSTNKGYILFQPPKQDGKKQRVFCVNHNTDEVEDELQCIVDKGGHVLDVSVEHDVYGQISADLILNSRADIEEFLDKMKNSTDKPLKELTGSIHYHTVEAESEDILDRIEVKLREKGYLYL